MCCREPSPYLQGYTQFCNATGYLAQAHRQSRTAVLNSRHALQVRCARQTSKQQRLKAAGQPPVLPQVSPPVSHLNSPSATAAQPPAGAARELRELGKTLRQCGPHVKQAEVRKALAGVQIQTLGHVTCIFRASGKWMESKGLAQGYPGQLVSHTSRHARRSHRAWLARPGASRGYRRPPRHGLPWREVCVWETDERPSQGKSP